MLGVFVCSGGWLDVSFLSRAIESRHGVQWLREKNVGFKGYLILRGGVRVLVLCSYEFCTDHIVFLSETFWKCVP